MFLHLIQPLRLAARAMVSEHSPRRMAVGVMLGMVLGMVPKGNLTAVLLAVVVLSLRIHLGAALLSMVGFSWFGAVCDPICHAIGQRLLTLQFLEPLWTWLYDLPIVPWTGFNNTVVLGSFVLAVYLMVPVYLTSLMVFEGCQPWLRERIRRFKVAQMLTAGDVATRLRAE